MHAGVDIDSRSAKRDAGGKPVIGVDIGSRTTCAVVLNGVRIISSSLIYTGPDSAKSSQKATEDALASAGMTFQDVGYITACGYGRFIAPMADDVATEIACHAKGVNWYFPAARTVLDMGGQDCKAIRVDGDGNHVNFAMNDKCAAGTGRFLEIMADALGVRLDDFGDLSLQADREARVSSTCTVFAKSEAMSLLREGVPKLEIIAGLHEAIAVRVHGLLRRVGIEKEFCITGGVARNVGVVRRLERKTGLPAMIPEDPQIVGALGAALLARERADGLG